MKILFGPCRYCKHIKFNNEARNATEANYCIAYPDGIPRNVYFHHPGINKACNPIVPQIKWEIEEERLEEKDELLKIYKWKK